jgi:4-amino-4-deoxy-L-arabinose transferase-like glycosyltransferase
MTPVRVHSPSPLDPARGDPEHAEGSGHPELRRGIRRPVLTLLLLSSLTFFLGLGRPAITDSDEGFYAEAAREMVESGDWLTPHFNYSDRWQKPVLYYWLTAATYLVFGPTELAARLWSSLSGIGLVLLTWAIARRLNHEATGPPDEAAWLAAAIVATCGGCFAMARSALPDLPLAFFITLTMWCGLEKRPLLAGAAAGLGFVMKGPLAVAIPAIVLVPIWWRERRFTDIRLKDIALAAAAFTVIGVPWYLAMVSEHGVAYLQSFFVGDNFDRFTTDRFNAPRPVWFYVPIVIGGMLPWSMYIAMLPWQSLRDTVLRRRPLGINDWRLLIWSIVPLLFFTLSIGKQPRYILPVLPPLGIMLARTITRRIHDVDRTPQRMLTIATFATAVLYATLAVLLVRAAPLFINASPVLTSAGLILIGASACVLAWLAAARRWRLLPTTMTICGAALLLSVQFGALAGARPEPVERMAQLVRTHRHSGEPVGVYQVLVRNLVFYTRFRQVDLFNESNALDFLRSPERVLLVVRAADLPRLETIAGLSTIRLGEVQYLDTGNVRLRTLLSPLPAQDLDRVLLVANR